MFTFANKVCWVVLFSIELTLGGNTAEYKASDEKSSGQGIIFGTKPVEILIPYIKVLTKRNDIVLEPFSGSGSTLIACTKMKRRCYGMEKSPVYTEVIKKRWENLTGQKAIKITNSTQKP